MAKRKEKPIRGQQRVKELITDLLKKVRE